MTDRYKTGIEYLFEKFIFGIVDSSQQECSDLYRVLDEVNRDRAGAQPVEFSEFKGFPRLERAASILEKAGLIEQSGNYFKLTDPVGIAVYDTLFREGVIKYGRTRSSDLNHLLKN